MKSLFCKLLPALLLVCLMCGSAWGQGRIATVDLRKLFENYWKTKQAEALLKDRGADLEKDHKAMIEEWKKAKDEYQTLLTEANDQTLSLEERDKRKKSAEDKFKQIRETEEEITKYERQARSIVDEQRKRMTDTLVDEIRATVKGKAVSGGYALVLDSSAVGLNSTPVLLYSGNDNDLTEAVLAQLNAGAPAETPKSEEKPTGKKDEKKKEKK